MKITKIALFRSFRAPCGNVAPAQGILMVLGDIFTFWSKKCGFLTFCSESALFSLFTSKVHFDHFSAKKAIFCPKSDFGRQSAIWELREPPAGSRDRPRREPRGDGVPGLGPSEVADPSALASASPLSISFRPSRCYSSCHPAREGGQPKHRLRCSLSLILKLRGFRIRLRLCLSLRFG